MESCPLVEWASTRWATLGRDVARDQSRCSVPATQPGCELQSCWASPNGRLCSPTTLKSEVGEGGGMGVGDDSSCIVHCRSLMFDACKENSCHSQFEGLRTYALRPT